MAFGHVILEALEGGRKGSSVQFSRNFRFLVSQRVVKWSQTGAKRDRGHDLVSAVGELIAYLW